MKPLISVILPVYNQEKYIAETIESILAQTFDDFELLILDDGSTDDSAKIIKQYIGKDNRITAFFDKNVGRCEATNKLVEKAKGDWCALLDADDLMLPYRLEKQVAFHQTNPEIDASSCHCYYINEKNQTIGILQYQQLRSVEEARKVKFNLEFIHCAITGLMISKKAFQRIGGLRTQFWPADDSDFFNRIFENDCSIVIIQEVLMQYRVHTSSITAQKPMHMFNRGAYVSHCIELRKNNKEEITFEEYMSLRQSDSWMEKLSRKRNCYAVIFHRHAGFSLYSKNYVRFIILLITSFLLWPNYIVATIINKIKFKGKIING